MYLCYSLCFSYSIESYDQTFFCHCTQHIVLPDTSVKIGSKFAETASASANISTTEVNFGECIETISDKLLVNLELEIPLEYA
jgi:hypothetical protein